MVTTSARRKDAFEAAQYIMDSLKTGAPFWKKKHTDQGHHWVAPSDTDQKAVQQWQNGPG